MRRARNCGTNARMHRTARSFFGIGGSTSNDNKRERIMAGVMRRISAAIGLILLALFTIASGAWGALALLYSSPLSETARIVLAAIFGIVASVAAIALAVRRWRWRALAVYLVAVLRCCWFFSLEPSNDRDWQADVAVLPYATIEGDLVTMHNIRNFDYRSETDYTPAYYDKRFDSAQADGRRSRRRLLDGPGDRAHLRELRVCRRRPSGRFDRNAQGKRRGYSTSRASSGSTNSITSSPTNATSSGCAPTIVTIRRKRSMSTARRARSRTAGGCSSST